MSKFIRSFTHFYFLVEVSPPTIYTHIQAFGDVRLIQWLRKDEGKKEGEDHGFEFLK